MDPFTTIWRSYGSSGGRRTGVYHLTPDCPMVQVSREGRKIVKGRLGAMQAAGRRLCAYEAKEGRHESSS